MNIFKEIKYFIQRGRRGYSDSDTWDFDDYLADVISKGLKVLKDNLHSYPVEFETIEQWQEILDSIIDGFEAYQQTGDIDCPVEDYIKEHNKLMVKFNTGMKLFTKYFNHLWD